VEDTPIALFYYAFHDQQEQATAKVIGAILKQLAVRGEVLEGGRKEFRKGKKQVGGRGLRLPDIVQELKHALATAPSSVPNRQVRPSSGNDGTDYSSQSIVLGVLGRTTPGNVRTGRTTGDYSPSAWTSCTSQAEIIHLQTSYFHIMRHHSCSPRRSPAVPHRPRPSSPFPGHPQ